MILMPGTVAASDATNSSSKWSQARMMPNPMKRRLGQSFSKSSATLPRAPFSLLVDIFTYLLFCVLYMVARLRNATSREIVIEGEYRSFRYALNPSRA